MFRNLQQEVDKFLEERAKLEEKSEKIINWFTNEHIKSEVNNLVKYVDENGAPIHVSAINEFKEHYDSNSLTADDIKTYLTVLKVHKKQMKKYVDKDDSIEKSAEE